MAIFLQNLLNLILIFDLSSRERSKIIDQDHDLIARSMGKIKRSKITSCDLDRDLDHDLDQLRSFREIKIVIFYSSGIASILLRVLPIVQFGVE